MEMPGAATKTFHEIRCGTCGHWIMDCEAAKTKIRTTCRDFKCRREWIYEIDGADLKVTLGDGSKRNRTNGDIAAQTK